MKQIINGKKYDTETAKKMGYACSNCSPTDFCYWEETLYKKKIGEFFLFCEGGPATKYAKRIGNSWSGSWAIKPMSLEKVKAWGEMYLTVDEFEKMFGEVEE